MAKTKIAKVASTAKKSKSETAKKNYYFKRDTVNEIYVKCLQNLRNYYYDLFCNQFKWHGLNYRQVDFLNRRFWVDGTVACFKIPLANEPGFAPWTLESWDMYDLPETVRLINTHNSPLIPSSIRKVDKDVVLGYAQKNKKSIKSIAEWYFERIAQVEVVTNTNLQLQKIPFLIPVDEGNSDKLRDIVNRILNGELVIFAEDVDPNLFKAVSTGAPYIIDKLTEYKASLVNELKTYLGVNNSGLVQKQEQVNIDELNANNGEVNSNQNKFINCLKEFCENINEVLGLEISVELIAQPAVEVGQRHEIDPDNKPGPEGKDGD